MNELVELQDTVSSQFKDDDPESKDQLDFAPTLDQIQLDLSITDIQLENDNFSLLGMNYRRIP